MSTCTFECFMNWTGSYRYVPGNQAQHEVEPNVAELSMDDAAPSDMSKTTKSTCVGIDCMGEKTDFRPLRISSDCDRL